MTADQWGGPHWLVSLGQGICAMAVPTAIVALICSASPAAHARGFFAARSGWAFYAVECAFYRVGLS